MVVRRINLPLILLAILALLAGLWAGLLRMAWQLPPLQPTLPMSHGPLMVSGFLGTLIGLERAVGLTALGGRRWTYAGPLLTGLGAFLLLVGVRGLPGPLLITAGSLVLVAAMVAVLRIHATLHGGVMLLGAFTWLTGNVLWLFGHSIPQVVLWWAGFLVFTIVGERLELNRVLRLSRVKVAVFLLAVTILVAGMVTSIVAYAPGMRLAGASLIALAIWLLTFDIARRTIRKTGLTRFIAVALLAGYVWLAVAGVLGLRFGGVTSGLLYDAFLHSIFVGFVFSMIFAHAPIIAPAILGISMSYSSWFYLPLALLQASLLLRVVGDLAGWTAARQWGGMLNEVAILLLLATLVLAVRRGRRATM